MIVFDLICACGFPFEGWFKDRDDYEMQLKLGALQCPECGNEQVHKVLSPVAVRKTSLVSAASPKPVSPDSHPIDSVSGEAEVGRKILEKLQKYVEKNFEDVGPKLAEESLKMHYGVSKQRNIRGTTSEEQEKVLKKEGIELLKIPMIVKKDKKKLD